jgi:hypothetical protein
MSLALSEKQEALPAQAILMLTVAIEELEATKAEPKLAKVRAQILSVESTLKELLVLARKAGAEAIDE